MCMGGLGIQNQNHGWTKYYDTLSQSFSNSGTYTIDLEVVSSDLLPGSEISNTMRQVATGGSAQWAQSSSVHFYTLKEAFLSSLNLSYWCLSCCI